MAGTTLEIPVMRLMKDATVKVKLKGYRGWMWRARVAVWLMRLAVWLTGMGCEIEDFEPLELPDPNRPSAEALKQMIVPRFIGRKHEEEDAP